jgi:hypothetical protein
MKPNEQAAFTQLMTDALAYYRQPVSEFTLTVWWLAMQPYTIEQVRKAISAHVMNPENGQFAPKVADVVKVLSGTSTDRAALAWGKVHEAMSAVGAYTDVVFDDPAIHAVVQDMGGWPKCCRAELKELGYLQHRFTEGYKAYAGRGVFPYPRALMGDRSPDSEYEKRLLPLPKPALVGDPVAALRVYEGGEAGGKTLITHASAALPQLKNVSHETRSPA